MGTGHREVGRRHERVGTPGQPFGAVPLQHAEISAGRNVQEAGRAGYGAWIGVVFGTAAKLAISFLMVGIFIFQQWLGG